MYYILSLILKIFDIICSDTVDFSTHLIALTILIETNATVLFLIGYKLDKALTFDLQQGYNK